MPVAAAATAPTVEIVRDHPLTPGAYLKARRCAAGLTIEDVAAHIAAEPPMPLHRRIEWLRLIEADVQPATFNTIVRLRMIYRFDLTALESLAAIALGDRRHPPRLCRICACSTYDACLDEYRQPCGWAGRDVCTSCAPPAEQATA